MINTISALIILGWALLHLIGRRSAGIIGKLLYFLVAVEAGAICFPDTGKLSNPRELLPLFAITIIYQEISLNFRKTT